MTFQANSLCRHAQHIGQNFLYQTVDAYSDRSDTIRIGIHIHVHCFNDSDRSDTILHRFNDSDRSDAMPSMYNIMITDLYDSMIQVLLTVHSRPIYHQSGNYDAKTIT